MIDELSKLTADEIDLKMHYLEDEADRFPADKDRNLDKALWSLTIDLMNTTKVSFPVTLALAYALRMLGVEALIHSSNQQPESCQSVVWTYLESSEKYLDNGSVLVPQYRQLDSKRRRLSIQSNTEKTELHALVASISVLYARLMADDGIIAILSELTGKEQVNNPNGFGLDTPCTEFCSTLNQDLMASLNHGRPLHFQKECLPSSSALLDTNLDQQDSIQLVVAAEVQRAVGIDLHTHLLPPTHGPLCLWGIDELLTYHYLVAEYFITAPASMTPKLFYSLPKQKQADTIWKALFIDRLPLSEACRGIVTTLKSLGLQNEWERRSLKAIRAFYATFRNDGVEGAERFCEHVFANSGIEYSIMTNIPFDPNEEMYWKPKRASYSTRFRSALRVDPLLAGDKPTIEAALRSSGYDITLESARQYLRDWCETMKPEYMMASTPHDFVIPEGTLASVSYKQKNTVDSNALKEPFAFVPAVASHAANCSPPEDEAPSIIDEQSDFLSQVLMPVCEELDLPVALKIGAHRGVNPGLKAAGDGVVAFADAGMIARLCTRFPKVRFLATFLSRNNQHEACVLASKFRNLHLYGCWWYCNNPSIIREITKMRMEFLGTAFTAQHSDARVVDQLLYKWPHSRAVIAKVVAEEFVKLMESGCMQITRRQVRDEVQNLFRGSYEQFMKKSLV
ncbi:unnamed protein product [Cylindrotheca closterium]|uniref:Uncharacterized protein n=1 Tax=Cylindrotheca closterium TaxID=2856 RepID=A0AAD2JJ95_9STRA|nr:unnamed protein product [Cylindrotheca closterium]